MDFLSFHVCHVLYLSNIYFKHSSPLFILILGLLYSIVEQSQIMDQGGGILELHKDLKMPHTMIMPDFGKEPSLK